VEARGRSGLTLRRFARLARFDRALHALGNRGGARVADIAIDVGYYDEAHMAHDFADFCGVTPAAYRRARERAGERLPHHLFACD
jgi:AraC-like DNA-binding protein